jgi:DNA-binding MurR/RpiR family transcriptional regulator
MSIAAFIARLLPDKTLELEYRRRLQRAAQRLAHAKHIEQYGIDHRQTSLW